MNLIRYLKAQFFIGKKFHWGIGVYRLKLQFKRRFWNKKKRPLCWIIGHETYEDHDWGGGFLKCSRCHSTLKVLWRPTYSNKKAEKDK